MVTTERSDADSTPADDADLAHSAAGVDSRPETMVEDASASEATQWRLVWWRFRRHRLAMASAVIIGFYLLMVLFAPFIAPYGPTTRNTNYVKGPPEWIGVWDGGPAVPHTANRVTARGGVADGFRYDVVEVEGRKDIHWFVRGEPYRFLGLFETDRHLFGVNDVEIPVGLPTSTASGTDAAADDGVDGSGAAGSDDDPFTSLERDDSGRFTIGGSDTSPTSEADGEEAASGSGVGGDEDQAGDAPATSQAPSDQDFGSVETETVEGFVHILGTDSLGRDQFSRIVYATRTSLTIGLAGLVMAFILGLVFGGIAGFFGGWVDYVIQRMIEIVRSIPTIPLVMGLAAAFPQDWSNVRVFFFTSIILGLVGWTTLARRVRTMLLTLRDEDFVVAARLSGAGPARIVIRHMLPSFFSYIVVTLAIEFPYMILAESVLSFVGLGLRPPTVSWGVLLQEAQNVETLEQTPWLLIPALFVVVIILAFNFVGDGLRDAADPYQENS